MDKLCTNQGLIVEIVTETEAQFYVQGFEPRVPRSTTVFKTAAIDHSATSPRLLFSKVLSVESAAKVRLYFK